MVQLDTLDGDLAPRRPRSHPLEHLMDRVDPPPALAAVDLLRPEYHALPAVFGKTPSVAVAHLADTAVPSPIYRGPPAGVKHLVQVGADTEIHLLGHQFQGAVSGGIKAPRDDLLHCHLRSPAAQVLHSGIAGAGVQYNNVVRLGHGIHPAIHKLLLIFGNGIDADARFCHTTLLSIGKSGGPLCGGPPAFRQAKPVRWDQVAIMPAARRAAKS